MPQAATNSTVTISEADELSDLVRDAGSRGTAIVDYGVAHEGLGHPPPAVHVRLAQTGSVIEHHERDMTVRVAAGSTMEDLNAKLAPHNQFLPTDADPDLTLGEVINHNVYGPLRVSYGGMRDLMLGLRYVDGEGRQIHVGGRTVKNVAGYDLSRFMVGSLGEMGIVYEATLRTYAVPPRVFTIELHLDDPAVIDTMLTDWLLTDAAPAWLGLKMADKHAIVRLGYFGRATACEVQAMALENMVKNRPGIKVLGTSKRSLEQDADERTTRRRWRREASGLCKIIVPPASTGATCQALAEWVADKALVNIEALPVHGCIFAGGTLDAAVASAFDAQINRMIAPLGGLRVWQRRPQDAQGIEPFAPPQSDWPMLAKLKHTLDPKRLFNPGRFLRAAKEDA